MTEAAAQLAHARGTRQAHERESARGYDTRHTHARTGTSSSSDSARAPFPTSPSVAPRAPPSMDREEDAAPIGRDRVGISAPGIEPGWRRHQGWPAHAVAAESWPICGWIPVFSAAGEVPETHQVGQRTANARALQAAAGGCGLIHVRWVRRTFHFVCCFARSRFRHSDAAGGCLANVPCTHRWRYGRVADDPGRFRTLGGRPIHMVMPSCRSIDRHPQRPRSSEAALPAYTRRHWPLPSGSNAEYQVASWNIGLGRFYQTTGGPTVRMEDAPPAVASVLPGIFFVRPASGDSPWRS